MAEQKEDQVSFKCLYYCIGGRALSIRLAAAVGGISFQDEFLTGAQQVEAKKAGLRRWSGPPEIIIMDKDGKDLITLAQSNNCTRYVGE